MKLGHAVNLVALALLTTGAVAQAPPEPPKPGPEHKQLDYLVGKWSGKAEMEAGPWGPGGTMTWTESCEWFGGAGFHVVCKSDGKGPTGPSKGLSIIGWNGESKVYTFTGVDTMGWAGRAEGTLSGNVFTYQSEESMGGQKFKGKYVLTKISPTKQSFKYETSTDGKSWSTMMKGESEKSK